MEIVPGIRNNFKKDGWYVKAQRMMSMSVANYTEYKNDYRGREYCQIYIAKIDFNPFPICVSCVDLLLWFVDHDLSSALCNIRKHGLTNHDFVLC